MVNVGDSISETTNVEDSIKEAVIAVDSSIFVDSVIESANVVDSINESANVVDSIIETEPPLVPFDENIVNITHTELLEKWNFFDRSKPVPDVIIRLAYWDMGRQFVFPEGVKQGTISFIVEARYTAIVPPPDSPKRAEGISYTHGVKTIIKGCSQYNSEFVDAFEVRQRCCNNWVKNTHRWTTHAHYIIDCPVGNFPVSMYHRYGIEDPGGPPNINTTGENFVADFNGGGFLNYTPSLFLVKETGGEEAEQIVVESTTPLFLPEYQYKLGQFALVLAVVRGRPAYFVEWVHHYRDLLRFQHLYLYTTDELLTDPSTVEFIEELEGSGFATRIDWPQYLNSRCGDRVRDTNPSSPAVFCYSQHQAFNDFVARFRWQWDFVHNADTDEFIIWNHRMPLLDWIQNKTANPRFRRTYLSFYFMPYRWYSGCKVRPYTIGNSTELLQAIEYKATQRDTQKGKSIHATRQDMLPNHFGPEDTVYAMSPEKHGFLAHLRFYLGCPTITPPI
eukprot:Platyproteum_vivax@DN6742_c0_g1_i3.p1